MPTPDVHALTGPYVLNALPDDERAAFEVHLADCQDCTREVAELQAVATRLGAAVSTPPPSGLRDRVLAAAADTRQLPPLVPAPLPHDDIDAARQARRRRTVSRRLVLGLAAAGVAAAVSAGIAVDQYGERQQADRQNDALATVLAQPDARTLRGNISGGGQAIVVMSRRTDTAVVVLRDLHRLPADRAYQLWLIDRNQVAHSVGLATAGADDTVTTLAGQELQDKILFGVTVEPAGGSSEPTLPAAALIAMT
ncbi:anti-sigma factor [Kribbella swartbergensis]